MLEWMVRPIFMVINHDFCDTSKFISFCVGKHMFFVWYFLMTVDDKEENMLVII